MPNPSVSVALQGESYGRSGPWQDCNRDKFRRNVGTEHPSDDSPFLIRSMLLLRIWEHCLADEHGEPRLHPDARVEQRSSFSV